MVDLNMSPMQPSIQPKKPYGEDLNPIASNDFKEVGKQKVTQEIEQKKAELNDLKSQEVNGQINAIEIDEKVATINSQLQQLQNYLKFERDEDADRMVIFIKDSETNEILRQIPTEEFLAISKSIGQYLEVSQQISEKITPPVGFITNETV